MGCTCQAPGTETGTRTWIARPPRRQPPHPWPHLQVSVVKDQVVTGLTSAAEASSSTGQTREREVGKQSPGEGAPLGSLTPRQGIGGGWSTVHPGINQPESPPFLEAPEHSLRPTVTEMRACQDTWRRKKTRHQKQDTTIPAPDGERNYRLLDQGHSRFGRHPAACTPGGGNTIQCLAALLKGNCCPTLRPQLTGL